MQVKFWHIKNAYEMISEEYETDEDLGRDALERIKNRFNNLINGLIQECEEPDEDE